jgi:hypothetical protein
VLQNVFAFQDSVYWFAEIPAIQKIITEMPTFSEEAAHAASLQLEPRPPAPAEEGFSFCLFFFSSSLSFRRRREGAAGQCGGRGERAAEERVRKNGNCEQVCRHARRRGETTFEIPPNIFGNRLLCFAAAASADLSSSAHRQGGLQGASFISKCFLSCSPMFFGN